MKGYLLSPAAQIDLGQIWDYTAAKWGAAQAERYILGIRDACQALADGRRQGRAIDDIRPGYRKLAVGSHFLFFRITDAGMIDVGPSCIRGWTFPRISRADWIPPRKKVPFAFLFCPSEARREHVRVQDVRAASEPDLSPSLRRAGDRAQRHRACHGGYRALAYELAGADAGAVLGTALAIKMIAYVGVAPVANAFCRPAAAPGRPHRHGHRAP